MTEKESWADECIKKARDSHPAVNESVLNRLRELLTGQQCERPLRGVELGNAARALIRDMTVPSSPDKAVRRDED
jgi:hypothetical protein